MLHSQQGFVHGGQYLLCLSFSRLLRTRQSLVCFSPAGPELGRLQLPVQYPKAYKTIPGHVHVNSMCTASKHLINKKARYTLC